MRSSKSLPGLRLALPLLVGLALLIPGCSPAAATQTPFRPPGSGAAASTPTLAPVFSPPPATQAAPNSTLDLVASLPSSTLEPTPPGEPPCVNGLRFVQDINYPDDAAVLPGQQIVKDWLVENSGTCNWDSGYRLGLIGGIAMGTDGIQALYPARAGTQAGLQIAFTAPNAPGTYRSEWRARGPDGQDFGDILYIQVVVTP